MSLPFLKKDRAPGISIEYRKPDKEEGQHDDGLDSCSEALSKAIQANDIKGISRALRDAFYILDSEPHFEGPHLDEEQS